MVSEFMKAQEFDFSEHEILREEFRWGSFGKRGDELMRITYLKDLTTNHIYNILRTQALPKEQQDMFVLELCYRAEMHSH